MPDAHETSASARRTIERDEAVEEIDRDAPLLQDGDRIREPLHETTERLVEPPPDTVRDRDAIARCAIERRGELALDREERLEDVADRLAEAFGGVLHPRREASEAAVPRGTAPHAPVIEEPHRKDGERDNESDGEKEDERAVGHLARRHGREQPPGAPCCDREMPVSCRVTWLSAPSTCTGASPRATHPSREPHEPDALEQTAVVRVRERALARLAEEDHAEELHHDVARERCGERDDRRGHRDQQVDEFMRDPIGEKKGLQQQPLGYEAVEWREPCDREDADER